MNHSCGRERTKIQELFNPTPVFRSLGHTPGEKQSNCKDTYKLQSSDMLVTFNSELGVIALKR